LPIYFHDITFNEIILFYKLRTIISELQISFYF